jgi:hypothetical protein
MIYKRTELVGLASAPSNDGVARNGATLSLELVGNNGISVEAVSTITTSLVTATFKPQVSRNGTDWYLLKMANNASNVATAAGTGSPVTTRLALAIPTDGIFGWNYFRVVATLAGATTVTADVTSVTYRYVQVGGLVDR